MDSLFLRPINSPHDISVPLRVEIEKLLDQIRLPHIVLVKIQALKNGEALRCVRAIRAGMTGTVNLSDYNEIHLPSKEVWATIEQQELSHGS